MIELNKTINWKPKSTGEGRFGNWLENLVDWNLSRSRFWGIPIPIWRTEDGTEEICIGSLEELKIEIEKSIKAGYMQKNPLHDFVVNDFSKENYSKFDLHRPYVDDIKLVSKSGKKMTREIDLIDVWFDSGSMPYAQIHYPFENKDLLKNNFPADFIAEGVDQTRGWFFTLHAISTLVFDSVAYKNVVSNGLVLDKNGNKMSKRLGNATDPFITIDKHGADATRWYMISNAQPWDNLKFDELGIIEVQRKFFGTLYNIYSFFALYANIDSFKYTSNSSNNIISREEIDQWIISELNTLIIEVEKSYEDYEPTKAARLIQDFVINKLSNWHIRLSRRRFWKGEFNEAKINAYKTVYDCLNTIVVISSPIAPFFMDKMYKDLNSSKLSVHLADFPKANPRHINIDLEKRMALAQKITSSILSIRKKEKIRVRQPLARFLISTNTSEVKSQIEAVKNIILSETNVKEIEFINSDSGIVTKKVKPNFKKLGPKFGKEIKSVIAKISLMSVEEISYLEKNANITLDKNLTLLMEDVEISSEDISGYSVSSGENYTVALDINLSEQLKQEGLAREFVNRIQRIRKDYDFDVTDKILINVIKNNIIEEAIKNNLTYICNETLAEDLIFSSIENINYVEIDLVENISCKVMIKKN
jgi:isoleucyl-tRNA synthetase